MDEQQNNPTPETGCAHCEEYKNNWKRAVADYQNLQKDLARERQNMRVYAVAQAAELFLPIYDNFRMSFEHVPTEISESAAPWLQGMMHIRTQYEQALKSLGLEEISSDGSIDTRIHEVVGTEDRTDVPEDTIVRVVQTGYRVNGTVVRPAKVIVAKHTS